MSDDRKRYYRVGLFGYHGEGKTTIATQILEYNGSLDEYPELIMFLRPTNAAKIRRLASTYDGTITRAEASAKYKEEQALKTQSPFQYKPMLHETRSTRYSILDTQDRSVSIHDGGTLIHMLLEADIGILVSSVSNWAEGGNQRRESTICEHIHLAHAFGVSKLVVALNEMCPPPYVWEKRRYDANVAHLGVIFGNAGYKMEDVQFVPVSALQDINVHTRVEARTCPWWDGPTLLEALCALSIQQHHPTDPLRMIVMGEPFEKVDAFYVAKVEAGIVHMGDKLLLMPDELQVEVSALLSDREEQLVSAGPGQGVLVRLLGAPTKGLRMGLVVSHIENPIPKATEFIARLLIIRRPGNTIVFSAGYFSVLLIHTAVEDCEVTELIHQLNPRTEEPMKETPMFVTQGAVVVCRIRVYRMVCVETRSDFSKLGGFALSKNGLIVATGTVQQILP